MSQAVELMDEALDLARKEQTALEGGQYEEAIEMAERRAQITNMAWNQIKSEDRDPCRERLMELATIQKQLSEIALKAQNAVRQSMNRSKQEKKRMNGYHIAVNQALQFRTVQ